MKEVHLHFPLWKKYLPVIFLKMRNSMNEPKEIKMDKSEFQIYGNRPASDYVFNLEINNGKVINDINNTAVARDLFIILNADKSCKEFLGTIILS